MALRPTSTSARPVGCCAGKVVDIGLDLRIGKGTGMAWGCDLSAEYVSINSEYRT